MSFNRSTYRHWTSKDIIFISKKWKSLTLEEIAQGLKCERSQLTPFIHTLRKNGFNLPSKSHNGQIKKIISQAKETLKIK